MDAYPCNSVNRSAIVNVLQSDVLIQAIARELRVYYPDQRVSAVAIRTTLKTLLSELPDDQPRRPITSYFPPVSADIEETLYDILRHDMVYSVFGG